MPLVADIHFQPQVAMMVAEAFEKIRVNPGEHIRWHAPLLESIIPKKQGYSIFYSNATDLFQLGGGLFLCRVHPLTPPPSTPLPPCRQLCRRAEDL